MAIVLPFQFDKMPSLCYTDYHSGGEGHPPDEDWRDGRADDCGGLENRCGVLPHRGFESLSLRLVAIQNAWGDARVDEWDRLLSG